MNLPQIVSHSEWESARNKLLAEEKEATRLLAALAAKRRRLPMTRIEGDYTFTGPEGRVSLPELFDGRRQLIVYHFMFEPGSDHRCEGCSMFVDNLPHLAHLHARDTSLVLMSPAPYSELEPFKRRMGWTVPWYSAYGNDFYTEIGQGDGFALNVFLRQDDEVYRTYHTTARGVETLGTSWTLLDLTPLGRQETWEDSPEGWPQGSPYAWWRLHDEYEQ
ncbi:Predicted dithiol-disulfide oxidoreductase, DUF899 family [Haloechinothrix alba]|uniref:Predicted dithiol-disulfide oxidoreductase, DUF899 family n=1 Tax=Haloechinothrix alba TaxID=664784 RepID=A0A238VBN0_9PSEU|nr:DUF899 domain-containing protein [Haloechinothrix alba]SNR31800.1 Predicted dithiol-disulfide oxidoreductase, DUF899 family [Haloechinothrix alba]